MPSTLGVIGWLTLRPSCGSFLLISPGGMMAALEGCIGHRPAAEHSTSQEWTDCAFEVSCICTFGTPPPAL